MAMLEDKQITTMFFDLAQYNKAYYEIFDAWYSGDTERIAALGKRSSFWSKNGSNQNCKRAVHVPLASDIVTFGADLLFSETPNIYVKRDEENQEVTPQEKEQNNHLEWLLSQINISGKLNHASEICSAFGDVYLKINWDSELADYPLLNVVRPEFAMPEYTFDILTAVNFFCIARAENNTVWRVFERQEKGVIYSRLYKGTTTTLGSVASFDELGLSTEEEVITGIDDLLCVHIPNMLPNRTTRRDNMGRSDLDGIIDIMDALDESYSSWIRDIHLGKARLMVPDFMLEAKQNPMLQKGATETQTTYHFDTEDELYVAFSINQSQAEAMKDGGIMQAQFDIRSTEHLDTCLAFMERCIVTAGYSPQSFGLKIEGRADSGTALEIRERRSFATKAKKETYWKSKLINLLQLFIQIDSMVFGGILGDCDLELEFNDSVAHNISTVANGIKLLSDSAALSTETKVRMTHPDWDNSAVHQEVELINLEMGRLIETEPDFLLGDKPLDGDNNVTE
jgi:Phage portal protein, SPP1 Gp6-like.